jgi:uncharacterized protein (DUF433 family)
MEASKPSAKRINIDSEIMGGAPVITGTRVPVETIVGSLAGGSTVAELMDEYGITEADIRSAQAFAARQSDDD